MDSIEKNKKVEFGGISSESNVFAQYYTSSYETNGSPKGFDLESMVKNPQANIGEIISLAKYYYNKNGLVMRVVNVIRDFGVGSPVLSYPTKNTKARKVIDDFNKRVAIDQVIKDMMFELTLTGNVAGYNRNGERIDIYPISKIEVSPLIVDNKPVLIYKNDMTVEEFDMPKEILKNLDKTYPVEVAKGIKANKSKIVLNVNNTFFNKINSSRYEPYGVTFLLPAFDELAHKSMLKEAERSTATGIIDKILRISVGDKDHEPKQPEIEFYDNLINSKRGSLRVTVPHFVGIDWVEPDSTVFGAEKFEQVDKDLLSALGVSLTLIRGEGGGNYSEGVISIAGLIKSIDSIRENIPNIIDDWYKAELKKNGVNISHAPKVSLPNIEINKTERLELVKWLFEHAGLPYDVLYKEAGYDFDALKISREDENNSDTETVFALRAQPFQGGISANAGQPEKSLEERKTDPSKSNNETPRSGNKRAE